MYVISKEESLEIKVYIIYISLYFEDSDMSSDEVKDSWKLQIAEDKESETRKRIHW